MLYDQKGKVRFIIITCYISMTFFRHFPDLEKYIPPGSSTRHVQLEQVVAK